MVSPPQAYRGRRTAHAVIAMAGGEKSSPAHVEMKPKSHDSRWESNETKEEEAGILTVDEMKADMDQTWLVARNAEWQSPCTLALR